MFEQLVLVDHPNIVKLHKYWLDASEARARVSHGHWAPGRGGRGQPAGVEDGGWQGPTCSWRSPPRPAGRLHHRVRVLGQPQAVPQKDQEKPQGHERPGMGRGLGLHQGCG